MDMKEFKAILFDLDGVLIDSSDAWWSAVNATLEKFGKPKVNKEQFIKTYWGPHLRESFQKINLGQDAINDCNQQYYHFVDKIKLFPATKKILSTLKPNFKLALVTNTPRDITLFTLKKFSLLNFFDTILGGDDVEKGKPNPEMMRKACQLLRVKPQKAILVGDTEADITSGKKAGCYVIGLKIPGGDQRIEKLDELIKIV